MTRSRIILAGICLLWVATLYSLARDRIDEVNSYRHTTEALEQTR